jgi:CubicO group peptidase (beta-lactamase class C family)
MNDAPAPSAPRTRSSHSRLQPVGECLAALSATVAATVLLGACGQASAGAPARRSPQDSAPVSKPEAYSQCMRSHGAPNFPDPVAGHITLTPASGIDPTSRQFQAASQACASLAPSGSPPGAASTGDPPAASAASTPSTTQWIAFAAWLKQSAAAGQFSGAVLVADNGTPVLDAGYGRADRQAGIANTPQTEFCIASIGKLFSAVAIAQLAEQHRLALDDTIGRYLPGLRPALGDHVTIAELLTMTSGLDDTVLSRPNPPTTIPEMVKLIANERPEFKPGAHFHYSNDGYILLGAIIKKVSGQSYDSYLREHIFTPAGMTHTDVRVYTPARVPSMAHGYMLVGPNGQPMRPGPAPAPRSGSQPATLRDNSATPQIANPSGGAYSTVGDLLKFAQALLHHKLLAPPMTRTILIPRVNARQPGGPPVDAYTYGFAYQAINGITFVGHNGGTPGYEGQIDIYPQSHYVVVILTNVDQVLVPAIQKSEEILTSR